MMIGVIPARGGSKGVPQKNIKDLCGKPLICYAIEAASASQQIEQVVVSTDCEEIAQVARDAGASVPFMRPSELAQDQSGMMPVLAHALTEMEKIKNQSIEGIALVDPTAPFRLPSDIDQAVELFRSQSCEAVISGHTAHRSPWFNMVKKNGGFVQLVNDGEGSVVRRQDAPKIYDLNTVVWVWGRDAIIRQDRIPKKTLLYEVPSIRGIDIDTELDFKIAEYLMKEQAIPLL